MMQHMNRDPSAALPPETPQRISQEEMRRLPIRRFEGPIRLIAAPSDLERAVRDISRESVVGFDTETRPAFREGESYLPSLVQDEARRLLALHDEDHLDVVVERCDERVIPL